jgi:hypothetical protein
MKVAAEKSLGYARIGLCFIYASAKRPPTDADWSEYMAWMQRSLPPGGRVSALIVERHDGPNAAQRRLISEITSRVTFSASVVTHSAIARGVLTALNWFKSGYQAFPPEKLELAIASLQLDPVSTDQVRQALRRLQSELDAY